MNASNVPKDKKKGGSVKKKGASKGLRNVLAQPFDNYWPVIKNDQVGTIEQILRQLLSPLHQPSIRIPWTQLRKMNPEERLSTKKSKLENKEVSPLKMSFVTGINAVTRGLEKNCLSSVILDSHVESILIKHIITMSESHNIPIILVPCLKTVTLETIGFKSAAFAIKREVKDSTNDDLLCLQNKILELSDELQILKTDNPPSLGLEEVSTHEETTEEMADSEDIKSQKDTSITVSSNIYLYRISNEERVFIPEEETKERSPSLKEWTDYIPLGEDQESETEKSFEKSRSNKRYISANAVYVPAKIKRMQGNDNRIKATKAPKQ